MWTGQCIFFTNPSHLVNKIIIKFKVNLTVILKFYEVILVDLSRRSLFVSLLISLLVFSSFVAIGQESSNQGQTTVLATVNGEKITKKELTRASQVRRIVMSLSRQYRSFARFLMTSKAGQKFLSEYKKYVLDQLINQKLKSQKIEELGITVSDQAVEEEISKIVENNKQFKDKGQLEDYLKKNQKMSMDDLRSRIKQSLKAKKLRKQVTGKVTVSDKDIKSFYDKNKKNYTDKKGNVKPLEEVRDQIRSTIKTRKQGEAYNQWLQEVRKKANIEKKNLDQL
ncbi:MAG: peptidylprolyl isomerase [Candidatus Bipolaricaulia bacterium]